MPKGRKSLLYGVKFSYCCEWQNCSCSCDDEDSLKFHQLQHFKVLCDQVSQGLCLPICGICNSALNTTDLDGIERHSFFHSWVSQLKKTGKYILETNDWPLCMFDSKWCNSIPELPTKFECGWEYCDFKTNDVSTFITHVSKHSEEYTDSRYPAGVRLKCLWEDCTYVTNRLKYLSGHLDTHTQTKRVACPTCGLLLVNSGKLENHLKRQQIHLLNKGGNFKGDIHHSVKPVKCTRCRKIFSTKKLLRDHMKRHINTVKCPFCDMTAWSKSALERHILFRHSNERPFSCPYCPFAFKLLSDLTRHLKLRHKASEPINSTKESTNPSAMIDNSTDLDAERRTPQSASVAPIHGPLAQAGALPLIQTDASTSTNTEETRDTLTDLFVCPHEGCDFKTNKRNGYLVHIGRKHNSLTPNLSVESSGRQNDMEDSPSNPQERLYICHMCPVIKRREVHSLKYLPRNPITIFPYIG
ncbi:unnamed protein product [Heterobilharzia americana]|nr:unnamed protein product [Heterobilharzia americana]